MGTGPYLQNERQQQLGPLHIFSTSRYGDLGSVATFINGVYTANIAWTAANRALYIPVTIPHRFTVARFFCANGNVLSGTVDIGLYSSAGSKLISTGATAQAGASVIQYIGVTDQSFPPGKYYIALLVSNNTARFFITNYNNAHECRCAGALQEDVGASTLPTTMSPAAFSTNIYQFGFTQSDAF